MSKNDGGNSETNLPLEEIKTVHIIHASTLAEDPAFISKRDKEGVLLVIPYRVIEQLNNLERENNPKSQAAQRVLRRISKYFDHKSNFNVGFLFDDKPTIPGVKLPEGGYLVIDTNGKNDRAAMAEFMPPGSEEDSNTKILIVARRWKKSLLEKGYVAQVVFVSHEIGALTRAIPFEITREYYADEDPENIYHSQDPEVRRLIHTYSEINLDSVVYSQLTKQLLPNYQISMIPDVIFKKHINLDALRFNDCFLFTFENMSYYAIYKKEHQKFRVFRQENFGAKFQETKNITPKNIDQKFALGILEDPEILVKCIIGKAGTGKTILSLKSLYDAFQEGKIVQQKKGHEQHSYIKGIWSYRVATFMGVDMGFKPGTDDEKYELFKRSVYDNMIEILLARKETEAEKEARALIKGMEDRDELHLESVNNLPGITLNRLGILADEAQNLNYEEVKVALERTGRFSYHILNGDISRVICGGRDFRVEKYTSEVNNGLSLFIARHGSTSPIVGCFTLLNESIRSPIADLFD